MRQTPVLSVGRRLEVIAFSSPVSGFKGGGGGSFSFGNSEREANQLANKRRGRRRVEVNLRQMRRRLLSFLRSLDCGKRTCLPPCTFPIDNPPFFAKVEEEKGRQSININGTARNPIFSLLGVEFLEFCM